MDGSDAKMRYNNYPNKIDSVSKTNEERGFFSPQNELMSCPWCHIISGAGELMDGFIFAMITDFTTQMFALKHPFSELFTHFHTEAVAIKGTSVQRIGSLTESSHSRLKY